MSTPGIICVLLGGESNHSQKRLQIIREKTDPLAVPHHTQESLKGKSVLQILWETHRVWISSQWIVSEKRKGGNGKRGEEYREQKKKGGDGSTSTSSVTWVRRGPLIGRGVKIKNTRLWKGGMIVYTKHYRPRKWQGERVKKKGGDKSKCS